MTRWPALMRRRTAAEYLDMSEAAFEREVLAGRLPAALMFGGRDHWRKAELDRAIGGGEFIDAAEQEFWQRGQAA